MSGPEGERRCRTEGRIRVGGHSSSVRPHVRSGSVRFTKRDYEAIFGGKSREEAEKLKSYLLRASRLLLLQHRMQVMEATISKPVRIARPPGMWVDLLTRFLLTRAAHERFVKPVISDMRIEYCDALAAGHLWHARWIAARIYLLVVPGCVYACLARAIKHLFSA